MKLLFILMAIIPATIFAQETPTGQPGLIHKKGFNFYKDDHQLKAKELKQELYRVPAAIPYYKKYKTGMILAYSLIGSGLISTFLLSNGPKDGFDKAGLILVAGGAASAIVSLNSRKHAIRQYNKNPPLSY